MKSLKLIEAFPRWFEGGIFSRIGEMDDRFSEWANIVTDFEYFAGRSGNKTISPLVENALKALNIETADEQIIDVAAVMLVSKYGGNWVRLWEVANAEYNPIENYSMVEEETPNITRTETPNITKTETPNITRTETPDITTTETPNITRTETPNVTVQTEAKQATDVIVTSNGSNASDVFGFNSAEPVPQAETNANASQHTQGDAESNTQNATRTETGTRQHTETGTRQHTETGTRQNTETGTIQSTESGSRTETETGSRKLTRSGNIGVTTSQQMIESEIALRRWVFLESVFADVDSMLTCPKYEL